ncbi:right-handed parallel beta-helix repeat-containing protein [bacterium]|nr:right-handed parallel beta-helix repeat-containing protein [bacterium]
MRIRLLLFVAVPLIVMVFTITTTAQIRISGNINGTLEDTTYIVEDDIFVVRRDTLRINPGARLLFEQDVSFWVRGVFSANGTEEDTIYMLPNTNVDSWHGVRLWSQVIPRPVLEYCYISGCDSSAIYSAWTASIINNCVITDCSSGQPLGAISITFTEFQNVEISNCLISNNEGFGLSNRRSYLKLTNCTIRDNSRSGLYSHGSACVDTIINCQFTGNISDTLGGGIHVHQAQSFVLKNSTIMHNESLMHGGGMWVSDCGAIIDHTVIANNYSHASGGGIYFDARRHNREISVSNNTVVNNVAIEEGGAIYAYVGPNYPMNIQNTIAAFNRGENAFVLLIPQPYEPGFLITLNNLMFYENDEDIYYDDTFGDYPEGLGEVDRINLNGDSCDAYFNLFLDPQFVDAEAYDFHLTEDSPCIDAGNIESPFDPDSTITDLGAFYFHHENSIKNFNSPADLIPVSPDIMSVYPNPFNSMATISVDLPNSSHIKIDLLNLQGEVVSKIYYGSASRGELSFTLNTQNLPSGVFFIKLTIDEKGSFYERISLIK